MALSSESDRCAFLQLGMPGAEHRLQKEVMSVALHWHPFQIKSVHSFANIVLLGYEIIHDTSTYCCSIPCISPPKCRLSAKVSRLAIKFFTSPAKAEFFHVIHQYFKKYPTHLAPFSLGMYKIRVIESRKYFTFVPKYAQGVAL
jgi:hypothetical protein